ncbi:MAG TPA: AMP-binding protein, partial [Spirochaetota bacterium]|nr:AMP-binding protein [Spirochaetota bacterium]
MFIKDHKKTALVNGDEKISYERLIYEIKKYSTIFEDITGKRVAICFENRPEWVYSFFAGWNRGAINVLIDMMSIADEIRYILEDCKPAIVFISNKTQNVFYSILPSLSYTPKLINVDNLNLSEKIYEGVEHSPKNDEVVLMLYTSGTTG